MPPFVMAAATPIDTPPSTQRIAAPVTRERVTGGAGHDFRYHFLAAIDVAGEVLGDEKPFHHQHILHGDRPVEAEIVFYRRKHLGGGITAGDTRGRIGAGGGEEDQENQYADAEHDEGHLA